MTTSLASLVPAPAKARRPSARIRTASVINGHLESVWLGSAVGGAQHSAGRERDHHDHQPAQGAYRPMPALIRAPSTKLMATARANFQMSAEFLGRIYLLVHRSIQPAAVDVDSTAGAAAVAERKKA